MQVVDGVSDLPDVMSVIKLFNPETTFRLFFIVPLERLTLVYLYLFTHVDTARITRRSAV